MTLGWAGGSVSCAASRCCGAVCPGVAATRASGARAASTRKRRRIQPYRSCVIAADRPPRALAELSLEELTAWMAERGHPAYRARQVRRRQAAGAGFERMSELPASLRAELAASFRASSLRPARRLEADAGQTTKLLYQPDGGFTVESVIMRYPRRSTLCISSHVGCPIGCPFCATR